MPDQPSVEVDDEGGASAAAEHLLGLGHRAFVVIGIEPAAPSGGLDQDGVPGRRLRECRAALDDVGVCLLDEDVAIGPASIEGGVAALRRAFEDGRRPAALLVMSDAMAIGAMLAARDLGLAVPTDLSVIGYDDIELAPHTDPALTTVHQPVRRKGEEAVRLLHAVIERRGTDKPEHRRLATRVIVRASTGPAPEKG
jgi:DNA-binding LacI/PurR family transcriptional regulator